ncbi:uncharacterized protein IWZ02DRAFT_217812 [Phyllosticta citriasiana]|uniref:uncharacterized protein n=1 Tax=Phyllosticta citriasiana TaxID=595635 RepID=UPI0030FDAB6D
MSQGRPKAPGRGGVLYGVGPFLRRRSGSGTDAANAPTSTGPSASTATRPITSNENRTPIPPAQSSESSARRLDASPTSGPTRQSPGQNRRLPAENPSAFTTEAERIYAGQIDSYRRVMGNVRLLQSFVAELGNASDEPVAQSEPSHLFSSSIKSSKRTGPRKPRVGLHKKFRGWGIHKDFVDCSKSEQRKREKQLRQISAYWELDDTTHDMLSVLEELRPIESLTNQGKGVQEKTTIDEFFDREFYEKDDRDCSSSYLRLLSRYSELFCGDRRSHGLDVLSHHANLRQMPNSRHPLRDIVELISDDISKALKKPCLEKILIHPSQRMAMRLQEMRDDVSSIEDERIEAIMAEQRTRKDSRKLASMIKLEQKKLAKLVESLSSKLSVQMQRLAPHEEATLQDPREISIDMSFCRSGQPLWYEVEFPGQEFTYNGILQDELAPNSRPAVLEAKVSQYKKRYKKQQRAIDMLMRQIHQRAMRLVEGRLINEKAHTRAINNYIHTHENEARRLHRALLKSARLKASVQMINFHLRAHRMSFLHEIEWYGFQR